MLLLLLSDLPPLTLCDAFISGLCCLLFGLGARSALCWGRGAVGPCRVAPRTGPAGARDPARGATAGERSAESGVARVVLRVTRVPFAAFRGWGQSWSGLSGRELQAVTEEASQPAQGSRLFVVGGRTGGLRPGAASPTRPPPAAETALATCHPPRQPGAAGVGRRVWSPWS